MIFPLDRGFSFEFLVFNFELDDKFSSFFWAVKAVFKIFLVFWEKFSKNCIFCVDGGLV